eukprot:365237-Chlamydomonas_euryale.AAC.13
MATGVGWTGRSSRAPRRQPPCTCPSCWTEFGKGPRHCLTLSTKASCAVPSTAWKFCQRSCARPQALPGTLVKGLKCGPKHCLAISSKVLSAVPSTAWHSSMQRAGVPGSAQSMLCLRECGRIPLPPSTDAHPVPVQPCQMSGLWFPLALINHSQAQMFTLNICQGLSALSFFTRLLQMPPCHPRRTCIDAHLEHLTRNELLKLLHEALAGSVRVVSVAHDRKRVGYLAIDVDVELQWQGYGNGVSRALARRGAGLEWPWSGVALVWCGAGLVWHWLGVAL